MVLGPRFVGGGDISDFGHALSNYTYFRPCGRFSLSSVQRLPRSGGEKKKEEEEETLVNIGPPIYYVGRPNNGYKTYTVSQKSSHL